MIFDDDTLPKSETLGSENTGKHLLTHVKWISNPYYNSNGTNETGIRSVVNGEIKQDFHLIQHGWRDRKKAGDFIKRALDKQWSVHRIDAIMSYLHDRYRF